MKRLGLLLFCFGYLLNGVAQGKETSDTKRKTHISFQSINQFGLLKGESGSAFQLQTINGVLYRTWFTGIGAGIDYYTFRTIPLFFDLRKNLLNRWSTPFVFADIGLQFPWIKKDDERYGWGKTNYNNGLYYEIGLGYKLGIRKKDALLFNAGYSFKQVTEERSGIQYCPFIGTCNEGLIEKYEYRLKRISFKIGLSF